MTDKKLVWNWLFTLLDDSPDMPAYTENMPVDMPSHMQSDGCMCEV